MGSWIADLRYATRALRARPRVALLTVGTLALGIGAATAVASAVWAVLVEPLPLRAPSQLVYLWHRTRTGDLLPVAAPDAAHYRARMHAIGGLAFSDRVTDVVLATGARPPTHLRLAGVSANFFDVLGVGAGLGRTFAPGEGLLRVGAPDSAPLAPTVVVLSDGAWRSRFRADSSVIGQTIRLDGRAATVIGVLRADFVLPLPVTVGAAGPPDAWTPLRQPLAAFRRADRERDQDSDNTGLVIARLRPGTSLAVAGAEADAAATELRAVDPTYRAADVRAVLQPLADASVSRARPVLGGLAAAVGLTLLAALASLGALLVTTTLGRRRELAVRLALGAGRARLARMLLAESVLLGVVGGGAGVAIASWFLAGLREISALGPLAHRAQLNAAGVITAGTLTPLLGLVLGGGAALLALRFPDAALLRSGASNVPLPRATRGWLVAVQVAVAVPLLVVTGLLVRTIRALDTVPLGFSTNDVLVMDVGLRDPERHRGPADRARAVHAMERALAAVPDVEAAGAISRAPLSGRRWATWFVEPGAERPRRRADFRMVTPGYFDVVETRFIAGRPFTDEENRVEDHRVAVVDRALAAQFGGPLAALGTRLEFPLDGEPVLAEIVGVVEPVHFESLRARPLPALYVPYRHEASRDLSIAVRWTGDRAAAGRAVRDAITRADARVVPYNVRWISDDVARAEGTTRAATALVSGFAMLAALLAGIGLVATVGMQTRARTREFAVRAAVGATPGQLVRLAGREGLRVLMLGVIVGAVLALLTGRFVGSLLYAVGPTDPATIVGAAILAVLLGLVAVLSPARRAIRIAPMEALRHE